MHILALRGRSGKLSLRLLFEGQIRSDNCTSGSYLVPLHRLHYVQLVHGCSSSIALGVARSSAAAPFLARYISREDIGRLAVLLGRSLPTAAPSRRLLAPLPLPRPALMPFITFWIIT
jgi:hypothetical protein